jgi:ATP-dependent helicase HrpB
MAAFATPEILAADLAPLALELAVWGADAASLAWLDPPPAPPLAQARALLAALGALDASGRVTTHGRAVARIAAHPRLAHMMLAARDRGLGALAAAVAALLEGRRPAAASGLDLRGAVEAVARGRNEPALGRVIEAARQFRRRLAVAEDVLAVERTGEVLALAFPDRIGLARPGTAGAYRLSNGRGAALPPGDPLAREAMLAIAEIDDAGRDGRILAAAPLDRATLEDLFAETIATVDEIRWDEAEGGVTARRQRRLGALVLEEAPLASPDPARVRAAILERLGSGLDILTWSDGATALRRRVAFARHLEGEVWPDWSDAALQRSVEDWLGPWLDGVRRKTDLARLDLASALRATLDRPALVRLDAFAPATVTVPTGRAVAIDYADPAAPALEVKLQEMFGARDTPRIGGGRVPLTLRLLSPAGRPLQVTRELGAFWAGSYAEVRREMRGRYPRHPWPDDPLAALPTARAKPRGT